MKNILVPAIVLCLAVLAFVPTTAAFHIPTTGTQLTLYLARPQGCSPHKPDVKAVPIEWPANSAFFTRHGWVVGDISALTPEERSAFLGPATTFELYVDGVELQSIKDLDQGTPTTKLFVNNFADGLTGTHELRGWWFIDGLLVGGTKGEEVFAEACALRVSFV